MKSTRTTFINTNISKAQKNQVGGEKLQNDYFIKFENMILFLETRHCVCACIYMYICASVVKKKHAREININFTTLVTSGES